MRKIEHLAAGSVIVRTTRIPTFSITWADDDTETGDIYFSQDEEAIRDHDGYAICGKQYIEEIVNERMFP